MTTTIDPTCAACGAKCCKVAYFNCGERQQRFIVATRDGIPVDNASVLVHSRCVSLRDDNTCGCYELRPDVCRQWAVDGPGCNMVRSALEESNR